MKQPRQIYHKHIKPKEFPWWPSIWMPIFGLGAGFVVGLIVVVGWNDSVDEKLTALQFWGTWLLSMILGVVFMSVLWLRGPGREYWRYTLRGHFVYGIVSGGGDLVLLDAPPLFRRVGERLWQLQDDGNYRVSTVIPNKSDWVAHGLVFRMLAGGKWRRGRGQLHKVIGSSKWRIRTWDAKEVWLIDGADDEIHRRLADLISFAGEYSLTTQPEEWLEVSCSRLDQLGGDLVAAVDLADEERGFKKPKQIDSPHMQRARQFLQKIVLDKEWITGSVMVRWRGLSKQNRDRLVKGWCSCGPHKMQQRLRRAFQLPEPEAGAEAS